MRRNAAPTFAALATVLVTMLVVGVFIPAVEVTLGTLGRLSGRRRTPRGTLTPSAIRGRRRTGEPPLAPGLSWARPFYVRPGGRSTALLAPGALPVVSSERIQL